VVLGGAEVRFLKPVRAGERLLASARVETTEGKKRVVPVTVKREGETVFEGTFSCFVLDRHVLG
jgi:acyl-coenzyme A thioesterase PaaI-like protein